MRHNSVTAKRTVVPALLAAALLIPVFTQSSYWLHVFISMCIYIIVTSSLRFIINMGEWSFAHVPLMGMGAYVSTFLVKDLGLSFWTALPATVIITAIISIIVYFPCLKTSGMFFFFTTFAFGEVMRLCWVKFEYPFGGTRGLINIPYPDSIHIPGLPEITFGPVSKAPYYYTALFIMLLCLLLLYMLEKSRLGSVAEAIRESNLLSRNMGINVEMYKLLILSISAGIAAVGGSMYAHYVTIIMPDDFYWGLGIYIIIYIVVGGTRHFSGPIVGVIVFVLLRELLRPLVMYVPLVYGFILAGTLAFMPGGLTSLRETVPKWFEKRSALKEANE